MMENFDTITEVQRDLLIEALVLNGVFKFDGKQLYELPIQSLIRVYENFIVDETLS